DLVDAAPGALEQLEGRRPQPVDRRARALGDLARGRGVRKQLTGQIRHGDAGVRGTEVGGDDDAGAGMEGEPGARAAAGRRRPGDLGDEAEAEQLIDPVGAGGTRETGRPDEIGTGAWPSVAKQLEQPAGVRQLGGARIRRSHPFSRPHFTTKLAKSILLKDY